MAIIRRRQQAEEERGLARTRGWDPLEEMQDLMRWDPFREMSRRMAGGHLGGLFPTFSLQETKDAHLLNPDLPGVEESGLHISQKGNPRANPPQHPKDTEDH